MVIEKFPVLPQKPRGGKFRPTNRNISKGRVGKSILDESFFPTFYPIPSEPSEAVRSWGGEILVDLSAVEDPSRLLVAIEEASASKTVTMIGDVSRYEKEILSLLESGYRVRIDPLFP